MPATASSLTVNVTSMTATDNVHVTGYMVTTTPTPPAASAAGWSATVPTTVTFSSPGAQTAYAWARDAAGNVSQAATANCDITVPVAAAVQGVAINPQTGTPLAGASVYAYPQASGAARALAAAAVAPVVTDASGNFSITGLYVGVTYHFQFVVAGFVVFDYYNIVPSATVLILQTVHPIPVAWQAQTATVSGMVKNASTNTGLAGMTVRIRPGVANRSGSTITATTTTSSTGSYSFSNMAAGTYTAEVSGSIGSTPIITSYFTLYCYPGSTATNTNQDFPVTGRLSTTGAGQYRIVLNWGNNPSDLDSHLTGPTTSGARFHTSFYNASYPAYSTTSSGLYNVAGSTTEAFLDVDNVSHGYNNGPETTTIVVPRTGTYRFYVHHYAGSGNISNSGAQVAVYKGAALLALFNPPASSVAVGAVWSVFTMDVGSNGETISPVNTITATSTSSLARPVADSAFEDYLLFRDLPAK